MFWLDHLFFLVLLLVQPIYGAWSWRTTVARIKAGAKMDVRSMYRPTLLALWVSMAVLVIAWAIPCISYHVPGRS